MKSMSIFLYLRVAEQLLLQQQINVMGAVLRGRGGGGKINKIISYWDTFQPPYYKSRLHYTIYGI
jgi:hypothetical protein